MRIHPILALSLSFVLAMTACGAPKMQNNAREPAYVDVKDNPNGPRRPVPKRNPNPTAYEITMTIENAPGPFAVVRGAMQYDVPEGPWLPDLGGMAGTRMALRESIPVEYKRIGENTYRAVVYTDLLVDEDYYGLGICRWELTAANIALQATGSNNEAVFIDNISEKELTANTAYRSYFWRGHYPEPPAGYPRNDKGGAIIAGLLDANRFKPEHKSNLFALSLDIKKVAP